MLMFLRVHIWCGADSGYPHVSPPHPHQRKSKTDSGACASSIASIRPLPSASATTPRLPSPVGREGSISLYIYHMGEPPAHCTQAARGLANVAEEPRQA
jgi:hypothetical protein